MDITLSKASKIKGVIEVPADKSITHRAVILSSIATGKSVVKNYLPSDDCLRTIEAFKQMGVEIKQEGESLVINGNGLFLEKTAKEVYAGNSGTTARLLLGILSGQNFESKLTGDESLSKRPMARVIRPLSQMGAKIQAENNTLPVTITGGNNLTAIDYISDKSSAQVKSAVLFAGMYANGITKYTEPVKSRDHSERMLKAYGADIKVDGNVVSISKTEKLNPQKITVPGDISSAAFFIVAALITPGSNIKIKNIGINPTRDGIIEVLKKMGADITLTNIREVSGEPVCNINVKHSKLNAVDIDAQIIPRMIDEIPIFALAATQAKGITKITGAKELRVKESDRISAIKNEFTKIGAEVEELEDGLIIKGKTNLTGAEVESYNDHRIAMTLAVASLISNGKMTIKNADCVNISFPDFFEVLKKCVYIRKEKSPILFLIGRFLFKILFKTVYRAKVEGVENIPKAGGAIIAPNHMSFFDPPFTGSMMKRPLNFMAKAELFDVPVLGFLIKRTNAFPVKRGSQDMSAMRNAFSLLENGHLLLMFPEGTRSKDGKLGKARAGAGMVACNAQVPLIPTKIVNTDKMLKFKRIYIKYGKPIYPPKNFSKNDYTELSQQALDALSKMEFKKQ